MLRFLSLCIDEPAIQTFLKRSSIIFTSENLFTGHKKSPSFLSPSLMTVAQGWQMLAYQELFLIKFHWHCLRLSCLSIYTSTKNKSFWAIPHCHAYSKLADCLPSKLEHCWMHPYGITKCFLFGFVCFVFFFFARGAAVRNENCCMASWCFFLQQSSNGCTIQQQQCTHLVWCWTNELFWWYGKAWSVNMNSSSFLHLIHVL